LKEDEKIVKEVHDNDINKNVKTKLTKKERDE
jgi:hypothetical protein